ncbi:MAG TPA: hypothetical protein VK970_18730, partial [Candidatus Methylacidiphilales bacterium]|nr:hypothetical protein [Candidatus Methylacidiphilales bacterium]
IVSRAATTAGLVSGGLAIPPGPLAFATVIPDLYAIWKIQSQMIADIAAAYGKKAELRREHMLYCLFRHITSQVARDIVVRVGQRIFIRPGSLAIMNRILSLVGKEITQRVAARTASAWVPLIGAAAVGGYAWYDTRVVGYTAIALFSPSDSKEIPAGANAAAAALPAETAADKLPVPDPDMGGLEGFVDLPPVPSSPSPEIIPPAPDEIIR